MQVNTRRKATLTCALLTAMLFVGFGRNAQSQNFGLEGQQLNIGGVSYVPPKGWSVGQTGGAAVLTGPVPQPYQPCLIIIDPTVKPIDDMASQLEMIVNNSFGRQLGPYHGEDGGDLKANQYRGVARQAGRMAICSDS